MRSHRNDVFSAEQARQRSLYPRIEKIEVSLQGPGLDGTLLIMNRGMSTPLSCARRERVVALARSAPSLPVNKQATVFPSDLTEHHVTNSVLALVDGELWPLHRPLTHSCSLTLLTFKDSDPTVVNEVPVEASFDF